nr:RNA-directed DNA polymerase, eukaryota, reverse transcriptase zinc-binding domain protein [Tanacetum cinerariifolium]
MGKLWMIFKKYGMLQKIKISEEYLRVYVAHDKLSRCGKRGVHKAEPVNVEKANVGANSRQETRDKETFKFQHQGGHKDSDRNTRNDGGRNIFIEDKDLNSKLINRSVVGEVKASCFQYKLLVLCEEQGFNMVEVKLLVDEESRFSGETKVGDTFNEDFGMPKKKEDAVLNVGVGNGEGDILIGKLGLNVGSNEYNNNITGPISQLNNTYDELTATNMKNDETKCDQEIKMTRREKREMSLTSSMEINESNLKKKRKATQEMRRTRIVFKFEDNHEGGSDKAKWEINMERIKEVGELIGVSWVQVEIKKGTRESGKKGWIKFIISVERPDVIGLQETNVTWLMTSGLKVYGVEIGLGTLSYQQMGVRGGGLLLIWEKRVLSCKEAIGGERFIAMRAKILVEDARSLERMFDVKEIWEANRGCGGEKAPGPDGFNFKLIRKVWDIIKMDLVGAIMWFWESIGIFKGCNAYFITLITKVNDPIGLGDYRPVSLIESYYKIITKILAERIKRVVGNVVEDVQMHSLSTGGVRRKMGKGVWHDIVKCGVEIDGVGVDFTSSCLGILGDERDIRFWEDIWTLDVECGFKSKTLTCMIDEKILQVESGGHETVWKKLVPKKVNIFVWRARKGRLSVRVELDKRGIDLDSVLCASCDDSVESCTHCLVTCDLAMGVLSKIFRWWKMENACVFTIDDIFSYNGNVIVPTSLSDIWQAVLWSFGYFIWKERNARVFGKKITVVNKILQDIQLKSFEWIVRRSKKYRALDWQQWLRDPRNVNTH